MVHLTYKRLTCLLAFMFVLAALPRVAIAVAGISPGGWTSIGPDNLGGRIRSIAIHPTETNKMWAGAAGGGIWKTTNGGGSWLPGPEFLSNIPVTSIAIASNPGVMYAGTGDGENRLNQIPGVGVLKSVDGGETWTQLATTSGWSYVRKLAIHPTDPNVLLAIVGSEGSVYRSADGGQTWQATVNANDVAFDPLDGNKAATDRHYSTNAGVSWTVAASTDTARIAWSRQSGVLYRSSGVFPNVEFWDSELLSGTVAKSSDGGATWTGHIDVNHLGGWAWQHNAVWVDPSDSNHIIIGGQNLYRSTNGGVNWVQISNGDQVGSVPSGQHAIVSSPGYNGTTNRTIFIGGAGGVYKAADIDAVIATNIGWTALNTGLSIMQFHSGAGHTNTNGRIIGGTDGSGSLVYSGLGKTWAKFANGNGGNVAIDPGNGDVIYGSELLTRIYRSTTGGSPVSSIYQGIGGTGPLVGPFMLDPNNPNVMLAGTRALYRSTNVKSPTPTWSNILGAPGYETGGPWAIAIAPGNSELIWIARGNVVLKAVNGSATTPTWAGISALELLGVSTLLIDPDDNNVVYAGSSGTLRRTIDGGATWKTVVTGLPNIRTIQRHPLHPGYLYVGTDRGIYASENGGVNWSLSDEGPATMRVNQLFWINTSTLVAATAGRGMFTTNVNVTPNVLAIFKDGTGTGFVSSTPGGISCGASCGVSYSPGTTVTLTATAHQGSGFAGWGGACSGAGLTCTVTMNSTRLVRATFSLPLNLSVSKSGAGGGTVTSSPTGIDCGTKCNAAFPTGTTVTLTATPDAYSSFGGWFGACTGTGTCQVSMTAARSVGSTFAPLAYYPLTVVLDGSGIGTVTSNPSGINCGSTCSANFPAPKNVTLTAIAAGGSYFAGWTGACSGTGSCTVSMTQAHSVTAVFTAGVPNYTLTVFKSGTGSGPVTSSPSGIVCGSACSTTYLSGTSVTLAATPNSGSVFAGWSGACTGTASTCVVTMNAAKQVTATYNAVATLTVSKAGIGSGPVTSSPGGITCGSVCSANYPPGTNVTLTATPNSGSMFVGWSGACAGTASTCLVTMSTAKQVTASFDRAPVPYTLTITKAGTGSGPVTSSPSGIVCGSDCTESYPGGTSVTLTASPNSGSVFTGWSGACTGTSTCVVTMNAAKNVTATFNSATLYALTVSKAGTGSGPVTSSPSGIVCGSVCTKSFAAGATVTLTATANSGSLFAGWSGACGGSSSTCVVNMTAARNVTATFVPAIPLGQALDNTALPWSTSGDAPWFGQPWSSFDGVDAAQSGNLAANQVSILSTTVQGPGTLSFRWRVASQPGFDFLTFYIGGVTNGAISGDSGWQLQSWSIPAGTHMLEWRYAKDGSISSNGDRAWVDQVQFTPASGAAR